MIINLGYAVLPAKINNLLWDEAIDAAATCPVDIPELELAKILWKLEDPECPWPNVTTRGKSICMENAMVVIKALPGLMKRVEEMR